MVQISNGISKKVRTVQEFYDLLVPTNDAMKGYEKRFVQERPFFRLLVERYGVKMALDAGCGSGFLSLLLSELGVQVRAIDALARARAHAEGLPGGKRR